MANYFGFYARKAWFHSLGIEISQKFCKKYSFPFSNCLKSEKTTWFSKTEPYESICFPETSDYCEYNEISLLKLFPFWRLKKKKNFCFWIHLTSIIICTHYKLYWFWKRFLLWYGMLKLMNNAWGIIIMLPLIFNTQDFNIKF